MKFGSRAGLRWEAAKSENWGRRSAAPSTNLSLFNERSRVILGQVLCRDYMLDTLPGDKRDSTVPDKISNAGLIRTITARTKRKGTPALAVIILKSTNSLGFSSSSFFFFLFKLSQCSFLPPTRIYCLDCNLKTLLEETASSGGKTISPSTNSTDQSL